MPLTFIFRDLNLFKTYQEASNFDDTGIARTPGWNHVNIDWNPIEIAKDDPSELPEIALVIDVSGSMRGRPISIVKSGATALINKLFEYYPTIKVSIIVFESDASLLIRSSNNKNALISKINSMRAEGGTNAGDAIRMGTNILVNSTQNNYVLITMTDGYSWEGPDPVYMLKRAQDNGVKTISLIIDDGDPSQFYRYSDSIYSVSSYDNSLYNTIAYSLYQEIQSTIKAWPSISKIYVS